MIVVFFMTVIFTAALIFIVLSLDLLKKVYFSHKIANKMKYVNNGKFNEAFNLSEASASEEKRSYLKPIVDLDDKNIRNIIFVNNINSIILGSNNKLIFEFNLISEDNVHYYFITDNYKIDSNQTLAMNLITNNFPKIYDNDPNYYNFIDLKELGYPLDVKIKADDIAVIGFNGKLREMVISINDNSQTLFYIRYKSKQEMVSLIKNTSLYKHIMQWGIAGFEDSQLTNATDSVAKGGPSDVGTN